MTRGTSMTDLIYDGLALVQENFTNWQKGDITMPSEASKFRISQKDHDGLVDAMTDTFSTWATLIDDMQDTNLKSQMDAVFRSMIKHTVIMEQDLGWAKMILGASLDQKDLHPGTRTQAEGFISAYEKKYVPLELRDVA